MKKTLNHGLVLLMLAGLTACPCTNHPESFYCRIVDSSNRNLLGTTYQAKDIRLYSLRGSDTAQVAFRLDTASNKTIYLESRDLGWNASDKSASSKTFYLQLKNAPPDVLYVDVRERTPGSCVYYEYVKVLFNGQVPEVDKSTIPFMYVLKKQQ